MTATRVLVVGSVNYDITVRVPDLPLPNQTILGHGSSTTIGGKGLNQAAAAAAMGAEVHFVGTVGDDHFSQQIIQYLVQTGVRTDFLRSMESAPSGIAIITVDDAGNNVIAVSPGANSDVTPGQVEAAFAGGDTPAVVLAQLEIPIATVAATLKLARARNVTTILNPAPAHAGILEYLPLVDILTPNEHELAELTGLTFEEISAGGAAFDRALMQLQALSGGTILATRGAAGSTAYDGHSFLRLPAYHMAVVDTTGAGDVFNGTLAASIASGDELSGAMRKASAAAAISITRRSAENSAPSLSEVIALMTGQDDPQDLQAGAAVTS